MRRAAAAGHAGALLTEQTLRQWLVDARRAKPARAPQCLSCDCRFRQGTPPPAAFALAVDYVNPTGMLISGICARCTDRAGGRDGLLVLALEAWRRVWPGATAVDEGAA
jgi:hypothetical protein